MNSGTEQFGRFITVEGIEGVGKSTNIEFIQGLIDRHGVECVITREPGGTPYAERIRQLLLEPTSEIISSKCELLLMFAARSQHLDQFVFPKLKQGAWVVSDRFTDATYAYQGGGRDVDLKNIEVLERYVQDAFQPDLTILLDAPVELGMRRAAKRGELDRFEREKLTFFEKVRAMYLARAKSDPARIKVVDASLPLEEVQSQLREIIQGFLSR